MSKQDNPINRNRSVSLTESRDPLQIHLDFDIQVFKGEGDKECYSNYVSKNGNRMDAFEVISAEGLHLMHAKMIPSRSGTINIKAKQAYVYFIFVIECPRIYHTDGQTNNPPIEIREMCQMAFFVEKDTTLSFCWEDERPQEIFEVSISLDYLYNLLPSEHFLYNRLSEATASTTIVALFDRPMAMGPKLKSVLYDMVYCKYAGLTKSLYIKGKIIEILAFQQLKHDRLHDEKPSQNNISKEEREKMFKLRNLLLQHIDRVPSINELARMVGTNECYLKQHFKQVFGTTVYGYLKQIKMEKAKKMLVQDRKKVNEIAQLMGYKHANHFTSAFKKYYGYPPNRLVAKKN